MFSRCYSVNYKKNNFYFQVRWTSAFLVIILQTLCLTQYIYPGRAQAEETSRQGAEDKESSELPLTILELRWELKETRKQLQKMRQEYAGLYLDSRRQAEELTYLRIRAAEFLSDDQDYSAERRQVMMLEALEEASKEHQELYEAVYRFGDYLTEITEVIEMDQTLRRDIEQRYGELVAVVDRLKLLPSLVAERGGAGNRDPEETRVLKVEDELQFVILGVGETQEVRPGAFWRILSAEGETVAKVRIIAIRNTISAALAVEGPLTEIETGMRAVADRSGN